MKMKRLVAVLLVCLLSITGMSFAVAEEPVTITWMIEGDNTITDNNKVLEELRERTGINIQFIQGDATKLSVLAAAGTLPDVFVISGTDALLYKESGVLMELSDLLENYGQNVLAELGDELSKGTINTTDEVYGIISNNTTYYTSFCIRTDWLENVGMDMPTNPDELYDVLYAFTYNDPDGDGQNDTFGLCASMASAWYWEYLFGMWGISYNEFTQLEDGTITTYMKDPLYLEAVEYINKLYQAGVIEPDFVSIDNMSSFERLWNGQAGSIIWPAIGVTNNWYPGRYTEDPTPTFGFAKPVGPYGDDGGSMRYPNYGEFTVISASCEHPEEAMKLIDYMRFDDEGCELLYLGIEDYHFQWIDKEQGQYEMLGEFADATTNRADGVWVYYRGNKKVSLDYIVMNKQSYDETVAAMEIANPYPVIVGVDSLESYADNWVDLEQIAEECFVELVTTNGTPEELQAIYESYVEIWNDAGGLDVEADLTAQYNLEQGK